MGERNTIHVTGFPAGTRATELAPQFERIGNLIRIDMPPLGRFKSIPYAFVEYQSMQDAENAIRTLDHQPLEFDGNYILRVQMARSRPRIHRDVHERERDPRDLRGPHDRPAPRSYRDFDDRRGARYRSDDRGSTPRRYDERRGPPRSYGPPRGYDERLGEPKPYEEALRGPVPAPKPRAVAPVATEAPMVTKAGETEVSEQPKSTELEHGSNHDTIGSGYEPQDEDMNHLTENAYTQEISEEISVSEPGAHREVEACIPESEPKTSSLDSTDSNPSQSINSEASPQTESQNNAATTKEEESDVHVQEP